MLHGLSVNMDFQVEHFSSHYFNYCNHCIVNQRYVQYFQFRSYICRNRWWECSGFSVISTETALLLVCDSDVLPKNNFYTNYSYLYMDFITNFFHEFFYSCIFFQLKAKKMVMIFSTWRKVSNDLTIKKSDTKLFRNITMFASIIYLSAVIETVLENLTEFEVTKQVKNSSDEGIHFICTLYTK